PSSDTECSTRSTSCGATDGSWLTTRETVLRLTPAWRATSIMVGRRGRDTALPDIRALRRIREDDRYGTPPVAGTVQTGSKVGWRDDSRTAAGTAGGVGPRTRDRRPPGRHGVRRRVRGRPLDRPGQDR